LCCSIQSVFTFVLVHGGGPEINKMLDKIGHESRFVNGLRYTDEETMEVVQMVLTGKLNKDIVGMLLQEGGQAVGLSGVDSGLLRAKKIDKDGEDLGFVGRGHGSASGNRRIAS
jgi:acetylglutamate kinase